MIIIISAQSQIKWRLGRAPPQDAIDPHCESSLTYTLNHIPYVLDAQALYWQTIFIRDHSANIYCMIVANQD